MQLNRIHKMVKWKQVGELPCITNMNNVSVNNNAAFTIQLNSIHIEFLMEVGQLFFTEIQVNNFIYLGISKQVTHSIIIHE